MPENETNRFHINQLVNREARLAICAADCIVGEDIATGETEVLFGPDALEQEESTKVVIELDLGSQLAYLAGVLMALKGQLHVDGLPIPGPGIQAPASRVVCVDDETGQTFSIPAKELAAGMMRSVDDATGEDRWIDMSGKDRIGTTGVDENFDCDEDQSTQFQQLLFEDNPAMIEHLEQAIREGPESEYVKERSVFMAYCVRHLTSNADLSDEEKIDISELIGITVLNGAEYVALTFNPRILTKERVREIAAFVDRAWIAWDEGTWNGYKKVIDSALKGEDMPTDDGSATGA
jgi:hypothetical protein